MTKRTFARTGLCLLLLGSGRTPAWNKAAKEFLVVMASSAGGMVVFEAIKRIAEIVGWTGGFP